MRIFLTCIFTVLFNTQTVYAAIFPCTLLTLKTENKAIILPGVDQPRASQIYFFKNISSQSLWLDHPVEHRSASAGWATYLQPGKWSVLLVNRKNFTITCSVILPGKVDVKHCAKALSVCVPKKVVFQSKRKGTYWLSEDERWDETFTTLKKREVNFK